MTNGICSLRAQISLSGLRTEVRYDYLYDRYIFEKKIGNVVVGTPYSMTPEEYMAYRLRRMQTDYFRERNALGDSLQLPLKTFSPVLLGKQSATRETIFGPGGLRLTTQGYVEMSAGMNRNVTNNPTLPQRARKRSMFNFDQQIQLHVNAKVGDKIDFDVNYDTESTFDFQNKQIKMAYRGNEDDIIQNIEAGNVSMNTSNSLIQAGSTLFGIKSELQFGKLRVNGLFSQQQSESQTINTRGGIQTTSYEFSADQYDENRHFFLGYWFRDKYDESLEKMPYIQSPVSITRMEVWVTNRRGDYARSRNIIAFADLGESDHIHTGAWIPQGTNGIPYNKANTLYEQLTGIWSGARESNGASQIFPAGIEAGVDYEKLENARLLSSSEYSFQPQLGYLSLSMPLQPDEVLAVAYEFTYRGEVYQVGEFSTDVREDATDSGNEAGAIFLKLLKPVSLSPRAYTWDLMMKNIYSLGQGAYNIQRDHFRLQITWQSDTRGLYLNYIPENGIREELLLQVMHLDRLNSRNDPSPDGVFDFLEGYTVDSQNGQIIFPAVEPFGSYLRQKIGDDVLAEKYVYQELYDSTLTMARQYPEKNKFRITGEYRGSSGTEINLNTMNVARGSVRVTAAGVLLTEGVDYTVDYGSGTVDITNQAILAAGTPVSVTLENRQLSQLQRKTLTGLDVNYDFSKNLSFGATLMHYSEKPLTMKSVFGDESSKNTLWGTHLNYKKQSYALTNLIDMLPFVEATAPSQVTANIEFAQMLPGHYENKYTGSYSYLDDFESSTSAIDLRTPYAWTLAATPYNNASTALFPEAALTNHTGYGKNRALLAWFYIDGIFTRRNSNLTPAHIKNDANQLSDHRIREIHEREIFPNRDALYGQPVTLPVLNLSFYPDERGPYNLDADVDVNGRLHDPRRRWGGITRRMDTRDFEAANIEYIEFWLMDPFVNDTTGNSRGGDLYFNLGEISEDILKDGQKFFENGLPVEGDTAAIGRSVWGKYPKRESTVYGFDNSLGTVSRKLQDVGLNGLSSEEEKTYPAYATYLDELRRHLSEETISKMQDDAHSPFNDPAGDSFRHYRGQEQDRQQLSILDRYKYYNGTEGNSMAPEENSPYQSASRTTPDVEDIDSDHTLNENESYFQYKVSLRPGTLEVGSNFITDKREVSLKLRNGNDGNVTWYQFRIPIREYQTRVGNIQGFHNIRFMRMFLTGFEEPVFLRFATLELVRSEWRSYRNDIISGGTSAGTGNLEISAVNIEENGNRTPVNYLLPPGITRILDPAQPQLRQENEQSLSLKVTHLDPGDARAVYKNSMYDLRRYKRIQMFVHAEQLRDDTDRLQEGDFSIFLRLGSDYRNNFYEYEIPLRLTPAGQYSANTPLGQQTVWPKENMFDFPLELFTGLKLDRNANSKPGNGIDYFTPYTQSDPVKPDNRITIMGNPSLAEVKVLMIGIRNKSREVRSGEIWVNEMRLSEFDEKGGWATRGNMNLTLSDLGTFHFAGQKETAGFGALDQNLLARRNDDYSSVQISMNMELGRFLPKKAKISAPFHYVWSDESMAPLYDPFNQDILLKESLNGATNQAIRDSINSVALARRSIRGLSLNNVKTDVKSKKPMPYDPANFSFSYARNEEKYHDPDTEYSFTKDFRLETQYSYTPLAKPWEPFKAVDNSSGWSKLIQSFYFNYLPNNIGINSSITRHYQETKLRDLQTHLFFDSDFYWNRNILFDWDPIGNLHTSFRSGTIAEIEEPYLQVNKEINRSDYEIWKDSVVQSIRSLGKPFSYFQNVDATYTLPFAKIPLMDWISSSAAYNAGYRWERGAMTEGEKMGNFLQNDLSFTFQSRFNLNVLYDKVPFLQQENKGSALLLRIMTMVRQINLNVVHKTRTDLPGYDPSVGDFFGQQGSTFGLLPGLGFAFGLEGGEKFVRKALSRNHLVINEDNLRPAIYNQTQQIRMDASIEPFPGLSIYLHTLYEDNQRTEMQYMIEGMPRVRGGSFAMSTVALASAFEHSVAGNNYHSRAFENLRRYKEEMAVRLQEQYRATGYPSVGFLAGSSLSGKPFDPALGDIQRNSADVLLPSFFAAYTGKNPGKTSLHALPDISSMLPNWNISYNMTNAFPGLQNHVKSLAVSHQYSSQYRIGSFASFLSWVPADNGSELGFIRDAISGAPLPSSPFDISSVSIVESFNPLIEINSVFNNEINLGLRFNRTRTLNLNVTSLQVVETNDKDIVLGMGYRLVKDLNTRLDISHKITRALIRKIEDGFTQATDGIQTTTIRFGADYTISRKFTLRAFFDKIINKPLVSSGSYATAHTNLGISLRFDLNQ